MCVVCLRAFFGSTVDDAGVRSFNDAGDDDDDDDDDATVDDDDATVDGGVFPTHSHRRGSAWTPQRRQRVCAGDSHQVFMLLLFFIDCGSDRGGATPRGDGDPDGGFATRKRVDRGSGDG